MPTQDRSPANSTSSSTASPCRVVVITIGGTTACTTDHGGALTPTISGTKLAATVPQRYPEDMLELEVRELDMLDSSSLTSTDTDRVPAATHEVLDDDSAGGVVIIHGTDAIEETAMIANIPHADSRPVVSIGAQFPYDHPETDGPGNLSEAMTIAFGAPARGIGALIAFDHAVLPIRGATGWHTADPLASIASAPGEPARPDPLPLMALAGSKVEVILAYLGADGSLLDSAAAADARDIVVEGLGSGSISDEFAAAIDRATSTGVTVMMTTHIPCGDVHAAYSGVGGDATLARHGVTSAGCVHAPQACTIPAAVLAADVYPQALF